MSASMARRASRVGRIAATAALSLVPLVPAGVDAQTEQPELLFADAQPRGGGVGGAANVDGVPGDELLLTTLSGGFSVARGDGAIVWRYPTTVWSRPAFIPDVSGDGRPDVAAQLGFPGDPGEVLVLDGPTGGVLWREAVHSPHGGVRTADLNGDGHLDLVTPAVDGAIRIRAFFGPAFDTGWTATLPGTMNAFWVFGESLDVGNLDGDPAAEVVFGTRQSGNAGGTVQVLDGRTGATKWSSDTGSVFGVKVAAGRLVAIVWRSVVLTFRAELVGWAGSGGAPAWTLPLAGHLKAANMLVADVDADGQPEAVVGTTSAQEGSMLFGLDPSTTVVYAVGAADGRLRWASKVNRELSSLAAVPRTGGGSDVAYGTDAFLTSFPDEQVGLLAGATGAPAWIHVRPSETHDDIIAGVVHADLDDNGEAELVYGANEQKVVALAPADGAVRFRRSYPGVWAAGAAGDLDADGNLDLVGGGADGLVRAVRADGAMRWQAPVGGIVGGVRLTAGSVLAVSLGANARVVSLDPLTGAERWSFATGISASNPFTVHQQAFGDLDGDGTDDVVVGGDQNLRPSVVAVSGRTGQLLWRSLSPVLPPGQQPVTWAGSTTVVSVVGDDVLAYVRPLDSREQATPRLALLNGVGGAPVWTATTTRADIDATVIPFGQQVLIAFADEFVSARRLSDGSEAWNTDLGDPHAFVPVGDRVAAIGLRSAFVRELSITVLGESGPVGETADATVQAPLAAGAVPGAGVVLATRAGVYVLDAGALAEPNVVAERQVRLLDYTNLNGDRFDVPSTTQIIAARIGERAYAAGVSDLGYLTGTGGEVPGAWAVRVLPPGA